MSRSSNLYDLQLIDSQLDQHRNRLKEIAIILADNEEINMAEATLKIGRKELGAAEKELRLAEQKVKDQRLKIEQTDKKLYGGRIRNPKELQDRQEESLALKRYLSVLEDNQLECMLEVDDKKSRHGVAHEILEIVVGRINRLHGKLFEERNQIEVENQELETRRSSYHKLITPDELLIYERIRNQRFGVAVSKVKERACSACGATLTAALHQAARSPNQITLCETCGRILFS